MKKFIVFVSKVNSATPKLVFVHVYVLSNVLVVVTIIVLVE